ncbi:MAG: DUF4199 domain-containing protein [Bacteroidales bacterium]|jgi:hypothetical protein|nr:DUF4199 domain-containing protein [Bacteroidales bacterium]HHV39796.1 DUF4199 domain-containing protein [Bacteroidales bacterium]
MKSSFWNKAAPYGIILALISILFTVLQTVLPLTGTFYTFVMWVLKLAGTLGFLFYVMKDFGKEKESYIYADAFKFGLAVSFCSSIIGAAYYYLHVMFLFPDSVDQLTNAMYQGFEQAGVLDAGFDIDKMLNHLPVVLTITQLFYYNIIGLLWASLLANGAKHKVEKTPFD